jgi:hypothetical protein
VRRDEEAAGLPELSFASFRKGGFTEFGDAEATDQEVLAQGGHRTCQMLTVYSKGDLFPYGLCCGKLAGHSQQLSASRTAGFSVQGLRSGHLTAGDSGVQVVAQRGSAAPVKDSPDHSAAFFST